MHIQPNNESFIATGFWNPEKQDFMRIRKEFEMAYAEMPEILANKDFNSVWGDTCIGDEVQSASRGFDKVHKAMDLIKKKQYIFTKNRPIKLISYLKWIPFLKRFVLFSII